MVGSIVFFFPKKNTQEVKTVKKKQTPEISFYHQEYKERYDTYQKAHQDLSKKEVITLVNMNRDFDFYGKTLSGKQANQPRWKRAVSTVNGVLGEAVGQMYVEKYFRQPQKNVWCSW